jgi:glycosyltransferase involved in cell wall biosynthesis
MTVVAARPEQTEYTRDPGLEALVAPGIRVLRTGTLEGRTLGRFLLAAGAPDPKALWGLGALRAARRLAAGGTFDALFTFGQPFTAHVLGLRLRRSTGLPWVAHFSDPWASNPYLTAYGPWHRRAQRDLEGRVVRAADRILVVSTTHAAQLVRAYGEPLRDRITVLPHAYDPEAYPPAPPRDPAAFVVTHVGHFYGARTPEPLLRAAAGLPEDGRLRLRFVGGGPPALTRRVRQLGLEGRVEFVGPVGYAESLRQIAAADLLVVLDAPTEGESPFLPSKLIEYLGSGRPVLGITPASSETARVLHRLGLPVRAPEDTEGIRSLLADHLAGRSAPAAVPPPAEFGIAAVGKRCEEILLALAHRPSGGSA